MITYARMTISQHPIHSTIIAGHIYFVQTFQISNKQTFTSIHPSIHPHIHTYTHIYINKHAIEILLIKAVFVLFLPCNSSDGKRNFLFLQFVTSKQDSMWITSLIISITSLDIIQFITKLLKSNWRDFVECLNDEFSRFKVTNVSISFPFSSEIFHVNVWFAAIAAGGE